ncbi:MAG: hypothetical protein U5L09_23215 [Bacteroidales bacterium]|nr:hypothetical protein [Bacteroidales bacterium]
MRWLIVLYAVVAAAVVSILVIAVVENKKSLEFAKMGNSILGERAENQVGIR